MRVMVLHPKVCSESASELAEAIGAKCCNPFETDRVSFNNYDLVINYGCHLNFHAKQVINKPHAVGICKNKVSTFNLLHKHNLPTVAYCTRMQDVPASWEQVVVRTKVDGARNEGMDILPNDVARKTPAALYTEYFHHKREYRIVVLKGMIAGRYWKKEVKGQWLLTLMEKDGFEEVDAFCIKAANVLGIDYVGFDVLENKNGECVILEANSGPIITDEVIDAFKQLIRN